MEARLEFARAKLGLQFSLKDKQLETLNYLWRKHDCISVLPTGYIREKYHKSASAMVFAGWKEKCRHCDRHHPINIHNCRTGVMSDAQGDKSYSYNFEGTGCRSADEEESASKVQDTFKSIEY